jgi:hypothetical protein
MTTPIEATSELVRFFDYLRSRATTAELASSLAVVLGLRRQAASGRPQPARTDRLSA